MTSLNRQDPKEDSEQSEAKLYSISASDSPNIHTKRLSHSDSDIQAITSKLPIPMVQKEEISPPEKKSLAFWMVIFSICLVILVSSMDATIVVTAFPTIVRALGDEAATNANYVWISSSFVLASVAVQPLIAQLSNIFGRSNPMHISIFLFALGSGLAGGAQNVGMLIAGRTVQGIGGGGIMVLSELVLSDLVNLRERSMYLGVVMMFAGIGVTFGPIFGGALAEKDWRWVFWISLPPCGVAMVSMHFFLKLKHKKEKTWAAALRRVDFLGSFIFIASICSVLLGLVMGGTVYPWSSWRIIVPLVLGLAGWVSFHAYEASPICKEPSIPPRIFGNRTSFASMVLSFLAAMLLEWSTFFLPIYFMGVRGTSPVNAGIDMLPFTIFMIPFSMISGGMITKYGVYRPVHWIGFVLLAISFGLLSILTSSSSKAVWVIFQIINAAGTGFLLMSLLPSTLAPLAESDVGAATGAFSFLRGFGMVWGVTLPSIIFNGQFDKYIFQIQNPDVRALLADGAAYSYASNGFIGALRDADRAQVVQVYEKALETVWQVAAAFAAIAFIGVFVEKHVELRKELNTEYGLDEKKKKDDHVEEQR